MGPAQQILDRWFESDILKTTLATDAVIGTYIRVQEMLFVCTYVRILLLFFVFLLLFSVF